MTHLGRNLLPTWPILRPSWAHLRPNFAKNLHQIVKKRPQIPQDHPGGRQRAPGQPLGSEFSWFQGRFRTSISNVFCSLSFNFSWPLCLKFKARGGLARAAHWIFIYLCKCKCNAHASQTNLGQRIGDSSDFLKLSVHLFVGVLDRFSEQA